MTQKTYAVEIMGHKEPTYILESDVVKLVKSANVGAKLVLVGKTFINPATISRIRREYNVDENTLEATDQELIAQIENKGYKQLK